MALLYYEFFPFGVILWGAPVMAQIFTIDKTKLIDSKIISFTEIIKSCKQALVILPWFSSSQSVYSGSPYN